MQKANSYDVLILCETWLNSDFIPSLNGFNIINKCRVGSTGGGLTICLKNDIVFSEIKSVYHRENEFESLAVSLPTALGPLTIVALYRCPAANTRASEWQRFFNSIQFNEAVFIAGDFNYHHSSWGCSRYCASGVSLHVTLINQDFACINDESPTLLIRDPDVVLAIDC